MPSTKFTPREIAFISAYSKAPADEARLCKLMRCKRSTIRKLKESIRAKCEAHEKAQPHMPIAVIKGRATV